MVRITALHALASLLGMSSQDADAPVGNSNPGPSASPASLTFESSVQAALYDAALEAGTVETPFSILASFMRQPFPEHRVAIYR